LAAPLVVWDRSEKEIAMRTTTLFTILAAAFLALARGAAAESDLWLHVKVDEKAGGARVNINLPVAAVEKMAAALPRDASNVRIEGDDVSAADLRKMWGAVKESPDADFVTVEEADKHVRVAKRGNFLVVRVVERGDKDSRVDVKIPTAVVEALLSGTGDQLNLQAAFQALARHGRGELVTVDDGGDSVRIWVDHHSSADAR
jgi:hypothetical protein